MQDNKKTLRAYLLTIKFLFSSEIKPSLNNLLVDGMAKNKHIQIGSNVNEDMKKLKNVKNMFTIIFLPFCA